MKNNKQSKSRPFGLIGLKYSHLLQNSVNTQNLIANMETKKYNKLKKR